MKDEDHHIANYDWNTAFKFMDFLRYFMRLLLHVLLFMSLLQVEC